MLFVLSVVNLFRAMKRVTARIDSGKPLRAVVIGAGISGLAAAHYLKREAVERRMPLDLRLYDESSRAGGMIETSRRDGFLLEHGPDCFISAKPEGIELVRELGLENELIGTNPNDRHSFIVKDGRLVPVPQGFYLLGPVSLPALWKAPLFSISGKLRMALELFVPARKEATDRAYDESLASFVRRRFGDEALERFAQPMIGGIYTADPERLSLAATFPAFLEYERECGSVIRGLSRAAKVNTSHASASGARYSLFVSFRGGMARLTESLASSVRDTLRLGTRVQSLSRDELAGCYNLTLDNGERLRTDAVVLALPAHASATLTGGIDRNLSDALGTIPYASSVTINLAFARSSLADLPGGMGFVVPAREKRDLLACSISNQKFEGRAPKGHVLFRAYMGGALRPDMVEYDDDELVRRALGDLRGLLDVQGEPIFAIVSRHRAAMAQYDVGHVALAEAITRTAGKHGGLLLLGNGLRGIGIPDCIREAKTGVRRLMEGLDVHSNV